MKSRRRVGEREDNYSIFARIQLQFFTSSHPNRRFMKKFETSSISNASLNKTPSRISLILEKAVGENRERRENKTRDTAFKVALRPGPWMKESRLFPFAYSACSAVSSVRFGSIGHMDWQPISELEFSVLLSTAAVIAGNDVRSRRAPKTAADKLATLMQNHLNRSDPTLVILEFLWTFRADRPTARLVREHPPGSR